MGSFVITFREGFEAALVIGLILAFLVKTDRREHIPAVWWGAAAAVLTSVIVGAVLFISGGELEGKSEQLYEATAMIAAAAVVTWMVFWMRKQAATIGAHLREQVSDSLRTDSAIGLATVAYIGVGREGLETALFLFASTEEAGATVAVIAGILGLVAAVALGIAFYRGALKLDLRKFFTVTSVLVIAFAAFLVYSGLLELGEFAESELLEVAAPIAAGLYGAGFACLYLRDSVRARRRASETAAGPAQANAQ